MQTILWCIVTGLVVGIAVSRLYDIKVERLNRRIKQVQLENADLDFKLCRARMSSENFESECG